MARSTSVAERTSARQGTRNSLDRVASFAVVIRETVLAGLRHALPVL